MKEKLFLAGVLALSGCAPRVTPQPIPTVEPTPMFTGNVVDTIDCSLDKTPVNRHSSLRNGETVIFSARGNDESEVGVEIGNPLFISPVNTTINVVGFFPSNFHALTTNGIDYGLKIDPILNGAMEISANVDCDTTTL